MHGSERICRDPALQNLENGRIRTDPCTDPSGSDWENVGNGLIQVILYWVVSRSNNNIIIQSPGIGIS